MFDPETMRKRFHELGRQRDEVLAKAKPIRDRYDAMRAEECALRDRMKPLIDEMKAAEAPLFDIDRERGIIAKALNGKTGAPG